jgi:hypothetical protein
LHVFCICLPFLFLFFYFFHSLFQPPPPITITSVDIPLSSHFCFVHAWMGNESNFPLWMAPVFIFFLGYLCVWRWVCFRGFRTVFVWGEGLTPLIQDVFVLIFVGRSL